MIVERLTIPSIVLHDLLIPTLMVTSLSMIDTLVVGSTKLVDIKILIMVDILVVLYIVLTN